MKWIFTVLCSLLFFCSLFAKVEVGVDRLFHPPYLSYVEGKKVGLITNQTGVSSSLEPTLDLFEKEHEKGKLTLRAVFAPEHGLYGDEWAEKKIPNQKTKGGVPVYSLYGATRRPTKEMLKGIEVLVFDIQDIGCRSYTFASTLFYAMEEAAKLGIDVVVLDRPNPLGGLLIDGPMVDEECRSFVGYINVPYCHGMTIGELSRFFNEEYKVGCSLHIVPMRGWKRSMLFQETGLAWIPTSPYIPEATTPFFYPATGFLGEALPFSIGIGYTLPFKVVASPLINGKLLADQLMKGHLPGVTFVATRIKPFSGRFSGSTCQGVLLVSTNLKEFRPVQTAFWIFHVLKKLYPKQFKQALAKVGGDSSLFHKVAGSKSVYKILQHQPDPYTALCHLHAEEREAFLKKREKYLIPSYSEEEKALPNNKVQ